MLPWRVHFDPSAGIHRHVTGRDFGYGLLAPLVCDVFETLGIAVTLWDGREWLPIHRLTRSIASFEVEHGLRPQRDAYNARHFELARRRLETVRGEHAGYVDFFVPLVVRQRAIAVLVAGSFALTRPSTAEVIERFRALTGRVGHLADPEFAWYLRETLATVVLDNGHAQSLAELLVCLASLMVGDGHADELANRANTLRVDLESTRLVERVWEAVATMLDDRSPRTLYTKTHAYELRNLGLSQMVDQVLVGLMMGGGDLDPIDEAIRRNALQRDAVELARETGNALSGRVGEHGVVLLCGRSASKNRKRQKAQSLAERAVTLAHERYRISLHFGLAEASEALPLSHAYQAALAAAESALVAGSRIVIAGHGQGRARRSFHRLREDLARAEERPAVLAARFERYLEAVAIHCGYRIEPALAHLEVGFERVAHGLLQAGVLGEKNFEVLYDALERATARARTIDELFAIYRRAVSDVAGAVRQPVPARRDHNLRRALAYIHDHYQERLRIAQVARVAGFNRSHFSKLFIKRENMSFEDYVCGLRLERAQQLLADTDLAVTRVAELSGFVSPQYLCRVFRRARGITPGEFRRNPRSPEPKAKKKPSKG